MTGSEDFEAEEFTKFFFDNANRLNGIQTEPTTGTVVAEGGLSAESLSAVGVSPGNVTTDANGNITAIVLGEDTYCFSYDYENRLIEARYPDNLVIEFVYDGLGRRTITRINGQGVRYVYDGYNIIQERDERTDELITEYTYLQGNVFKQKRGTQERWFYNQPEGGYPNHVFGVDGTKTDSLDFGWFGELAYHRGETQIALGWAGGWVFAQYSEMPFVLIPESNEVWLPKVAKSLNPLVRSSWGLSVDAGTGLSSYTGACDIPVRLPEREDPDAPVPMPIPVRGPNQPGLSTEEGNMGLVLAPECGSDCDDECQMLIALLREFLAEDAKGYANRPSFGATGTQSFTLSGCSSAGCGSSPALMGGKLPSIGPLPIPEPIPIDPGEWPSDPGNWGNPDAAEKDPMIAAINRCWKRVMYPHMDVTSWYLHELDTAVEGSVDYLYEQLCSYLVGKAKSITINKIKIGKGIWGKWGSKKVQDFLNNLIDLKRRCIECLKKYGFNPQDIPKAEKEWYPDLAYLTLYKHCNDRKFYDCVYKEWGKSHNDSLEARWSDIVQCCEELTKRYWKEIDPSQGRIPGSKNYPSPPGEWWLNCLYPNERRPSGR